MDITLFLKSNSLYCCTLFLIIGILEEPIVVHTVKKLYQETRDC